MPQIEIKFTLTTELHLHDVCATTERFQLASLVAERFAIENNSSEVNTLHMLRAITSIDRGAARLMLEGCDLNIIALIGEIVSIMPNGSSKTDSLVGISNDLTNAVDLALAISNEFNHDYVGTEYILLGIMKTDCEAANLIKKHGVFYDDLKAEYIKITGIAN